MGKRDEKLRFVSNLGIPFISKMHENYWSLSKFHDFMPPEKLTREGSFIEKWVKIKLRRAAKRAVKSVQAVSRRGTRNQ